MVKRSPTEALDQSSATAPPIVTADPPAPSLLRSRPVATEERPDLPALERVTVRTWGSAYAVGAMLALPALVAGLGMRHGSAITDLLAAEGWGSRPGIVLLLGSLGLAAVFVGLLARLARGDFAWSTDAEGIEARGLFHRRWLRWTEVRDIHSPSSREGVGLWYRLRGSSSSGEVTFNPFAGVRGWELTASVWQHLRRVGRHEEMPLFSEMESFWDELPRNSQAARSWQNPYPPPKHGLQPAFWIGSAIVALLVVLALREPPGSGYTPLALGVGLLLTATLVFPLQAHRRRRGLWVRRCELTPEGLQGETQSGSFTFSWSDIGDVGWFPVFEGPVRFEVRGRRREPLLLFVLDPTRPDAVPFVFEFLHDLRYADPPHAVVLPAWLREPVEPPALIKASSGMEIS